MAVWLYISGLSLIRTPWKCVSLSTKNGERSMLCNRCYLQKQLHSQISSLPSVFYPTAAKWSPSGVHSYDNSSHSCVVAPNGVDCVKFVFPVQPKKTLSGG